VRKTYAAMNGLFLVHVVRDQILGLHADMEPWTMLGHIAARNRLGRLRLGIGVTDSGRRNPAVPAQAAVVSHSRHPAVAAAGISAQRNSWMRSSSKPRSGVIAESVTSFYSM
jgi:hypothetical protein